MARRKLTVVEKAVADAAKELGLPKDHWNVQRLSTMMVMLAVAQHKFSASQSSQSAADILTLMDSISALRKEAKLAEPLEIKVSYVKGVTEVASVVCPECQARFQYRNPLPERSVDPPATETPPTCHAQPAVPPSTAEATPPDTKVVPLVTHRDGVSASSFHSQLINGHEVAPLKYRQTGGQGYVR